ncbi:MAG: hypothetical protein H7222_04460 [Methylotenera sp.]|nr:hypothetical protein [Oligoflexia bacterium]
MVLKNSHTLGSSVKIQKTLRRNIRRNVALLAGTTLILSAALARADAGFEGSDPTGKVRLLWVPINRKATTVLLQKEFTEDKSTTFEIVEAPVDPHKGINPFGVADKDFEVGMSLTLHSKDRGPVPQILGEDSQWFDSLIKEEKLPDVFLIGGHHVISEGWHNDPENKFVFMPTLLETLGKFPSAQRVFDNVKLAILWGCNTLTNLEPHAADGSYLSAEQIKTIHESGPEGRRKMNGTSEKVNSLEFYKSRLAREYGPHGATYEYTRSAQRERCRGPGRYEDCYITNLERILPESFLYDGDHRVNEPHRMKQMFPNAYLVLGFSSASPSEEQRAEILQVALDRSEKVLNAGLASDSKDRVNHALKMIVDPATPHDVRLRIIEEVRKQWTIATYQMNRQRPSGSITPAFPELDKNGVFNYRVSKDAPTYLPYEAR